MLARKLTMLLIVLIASSPAMALKIADVTHLQGSRVNKLVGFGLVVGLRGTGDGGKYAPTMRALAQVHERFANPVFMLDELKSVRNVAIVQVEATLPRDGAREGEQVNVMVASVGAAKSLEGGRLLLTPLVGPNPEDPRPPMAMAGGPIQIENPDVPTVGRIAGGAVLEQNWVHNYLALGRDLDVYRNRSASARSLEWIRPDELHVTFVIDEPVASWGMASTIAQAINEGDSITESDTSDPQSQIAMAFDARTVIVRIPPEERLNPAPFLARQESLQLFPPSTEARVTVHRKSGSIIVTGDVEIAPAIISHGGLTITTVVPEPEPTPDKPRVVTRDFVVMDPQKKGTVKLQDLLEALSQLRVPAQDKITIIEKLEKTGRLYATLIVED